MAELVVSPLLQVVFDILASPIVDKLRDLFGIKQNFHQLQQSLRMIHALLQDAEEKQVTNETVKVWLSKLKDIAYDSDDLLDELTAEIALSEIYSSIENQVWSSFGKKLTRRIGDQVRCLLLPFEPSKRLLEIAHRELPKVLLEVNKISREGLKLKLRQKSLEIQHVRLAKRRETCSFVTDSEVYGRGEDREKILELLLTSSRHGETNKGNASIIAMVGIGGIGKTTLAQLVYNDPKVVGYFELKIWVCVSNNFDVKNLIKEIVEKATKTECRFSDLDTLQTLLRESLREKRYLLVLDDLWNEDQDAWQGFWRFFSGAVKGSKILVTTRSNKVAAVVRTTSQYHLGGLPEDDCWALFKNRAFGPREEENYPNLLKIGKKIIKKCERVPLAAKTLGSMLFFTREERDWLFVQKSELYHLDDQCQNGILPTLKLSYSHLPLHLKRCFAYFSLFPKNYEIKKEKLIQLWMAEGLIRRHGGSSRPLEDIGNDYFNELLWISFFEVKESDNESMRTYKMHNLIHDLAQSVVGDEFLRLEAAVPMGNVGRIRHSSVVRSFWPSTIPPALLAAAHLRTLLLLSPGPSSGELPENFPETLKYLRVLDLSGCGIKVLKNSVGQLKCLRYLDLSYNSIKQLPETICNLCNLQTLNLSGCQQLSNLPRRMRLLISLRHLNITGCEGLTYMPSGIGKLVHLQTCPIYIVGKEIGESISELGPLDLRGELNIKCLENVSDANEARVVNLKEKKHLLVLGLSWGNDKEGLNLKTAGTSFTGSSSGDNSNSGSRAEDILEFLEPHMNLRKLFVKGYPGIKFPNWVLPNLSVVVLINCRGCETLPVLGHLSSLKTLYLHGMENIKHISREFYGGDTQIPFPALEELTLRDFPNLQEWSSVDDREAFPRLRKLTLGKCPNLHTSPIFPSVQDVELKECHPMIINSMEKVTSISNLIIHTFPSLSFLPGELMRNNYLLTSLKIVSCKNIESLPSEIEKLTSLKSLTISWCEKLSCLPRGMQNLTSLESLEISECHSLSCLPDDGIGGLSSLKALSIENCDNLTSLSTGLQELISLEHLTVMYCPNLKSFPSNFRKLSALRSFSILACPLLESVPEVLRHVSNSLQSLEIRSCPGLKSLPEWIVEFSSLRSLAISECHNLTSLPGELE